MISCPATSDDVPSRVYCKEQATTLSAIAPFVGAGFSIHWLHPREKRPIGDKWQERAVATLQDLRANYRQGNNMGVRLGEHSVVEGGYLHVLDMDIRVASEAASAWEALGELFPGVAFKLFPTVQSGSGGESRHIYFVTDKPFLSRKLAVSGVKFTDTTGRHWTWEIELFGTGKQVAMPPSIHPDTGKPYIWLTPFDLDALALGCGPDIPSATVEAAGANEDTAEPYADGKRVEDYDERQVRLRLDQLSEGRWIAYESWLSIGAALHHQFLAGEDGLAIYEEYSAAKPGYKKGLTRKKWKSFGKQNRGKPITFRTIIEWAQEDLRASYGAGDDFDELPSLDDGKSDFDDLLIREEIPAVGWMSLLHPLENGKGWRPTLPNIELIVKNDPRLVGLISYNEFTKELVQRTLPGIKRGRMGAAKPTRQLTGPIWNVRDTRNGDLWTTARDDAIRSIIESPRTQGGYAMKVGVGDLRAAIGQVGRANSFHPVHEYLESLTWDGSARLDRLFIDYLGAPDDPYHRVVARLLLLGAVTRVYEPGAKFDSAVILEGLQGKRKSTFLEILGRYWAGELEVDLRDSKHMVEQMTGRLIIELPELSGFGKADVRSLKAFVSRQTDRVRLAYEARAEMFPRQSVFAGTTNDSSYLQDISGGRRWWPVACCLDGEIDTDHLKENIDQLWAEAFTIYREMRRAQPTGTLPLYITDPEARKIAARLQESRRMETPDDGIAGRIAAWLDQPIVSGSIDDDGDDVAAPRHRNETCLLQIWEECLGRDKSAYGQVQCQMLGRAMKLVPDWSQSGAQSVFGSYGKQRIYERGGIKGRWARAGVK